jgi:hypothetical protein
VSQAIFNELRNDISEEGERNPDANVIFGTYIDKDSSAKPDGIKKMLKVRNARPLLHNSNCSVRNLVSL